MKKITIIFAGLYLLLAISLSGYGKNETNTATSSMNPPIGSEVQKSDNPFFFKDCAPHKTYIYQGTIWGGKIFQGGKPERTNKDGDLYVTAVLHVTEIAQLKKDKIYALDFAINGAKNHTKEPSETCYIWVTPSNIYLCPLANAQEAKNIASSGKLPDEDRELLRCSNKNMKIDSSNRLQKSEIKVDKQKGVCGYSYYHEGNYSYERWVWAIGKGLTSYSWGYGAKQEGMKLDLVE